MFYKRGLKTKPSLYCGDGDRSLICTLASPALQLTHPSALQCELSSQCYQFYQYDDVYCKSFCCPRSVKTIMALPMNLSIR